MQWIKDLESFIFLSDPPTKADLIFLPGNAHAEPSEYAASLYRQGLAPLILPSGRYSILGGSFPGQCSGKQIYPGSFDTEWEFMHAVLLSNGVPDSAILREDQATFTYENAIYSRRLTDQMDLHPSHALIVCLPVHARRARMYYETLFPQTSLSVCPAPYSALNAGNWLSTPENIDHVLGEVERCGSQFHEILRQLTNKKSRASTADFEVY